MKNGRAKEMPARQLRRTDGRQSDEYDDDEDDAPVSAELPFSCMVLLSE